jgi:hypothetical protein
MILLAGTTALNICWFATKALNIFWTGVVPQFPQSPPPEELELWA